jgi:cytochrome bd-type quinol oxidase subunit 2
MPGVLPHLVVGAILFLIARVSFRTYFKDNQKLKKEFLLAVVCLLFSILPDFFLGLYYLAHLEPESILMRYQEFTHLVLAPVTFGVLSLIVLLDKKRRPLWIMSAIALILHIIMDLFIAETNFLW